MVDAIIQGTIIALKAIIFTTIMSVTAEKSNKKGWRHRK